tara:strand:- start:659 stop:2056 length:1398 start_codon:yes stop_codon:yes gene_type:complete
MAKKTGLTKSGNMDKRTTEWKTLGSTISQVNKEIDAGNITIEEGLKRIHPLYQGLVSREQDLKELVKERAKNQEGYLGKFREGLGLSLTENQLLEAKAALIHAQRTGNKEDIEDAEEGIKKLNELNKAQGEIFDDMRSFFPGIFSAIEGIGKMQAVWNMIANMNPYVRIAAVLLAIGATLLMLVKRVNAMREQFGLARVEAAKVAGQLTLVNIKMKFFGISAEQVSSSMEAIANTFGEVSPAMVRFAGDMALVARNSGITAEEAASMVSLFQATHGATKEVALDMIESTRAMAELTGLSPGIIMSEIASQADLFASHLGQSEQHLIAAVAQAKKLGMEFGDLNEFGDGLLDITERINKEQMLSAMLGKQVNLERAAMLKAQGDEVGFMQELSSQMQGVAHLTAQQRRLFSQELGIATADVMKLAGLQSGMATKNANVPGQNPYEQARYKQGERMLKAINNPQYAS